MYNRILSFFKKHNALANVQHGFMENKSTQTASQSFIESVQEALNRHLHVVGIFLDLSKAYDIINRNMLLDKVYSYGVRGSANMWFKSYLTNRTQFVEISQTDRSNHTRRISIFTYGDCTWSAAGLNFRAPLIFSIYKRPTIEYPGSKITYICRLYEYIGHW